MEEVELGMMPDLSEGLPNEEEMWQKIQQIRSLPVTMAEKRVLKAELKVNIILCHHVKYVRFNCSIDGFRLHKTSASTVWN